VKQKIKAIEKQRIKGEKRKTKIINKCFAVLLIIRKLTNKKTNDCVVKTNTEDEKKIRFLREGKVEEKQRRATEEE
jgi:hypothetical protein